MQEIKFITATGPDLETCQLNLYKEIAKQCFRQAWRLVSVSFFPTIAPDAPSSHLVAIPGQAPQLKMVFTGHAALQEDPIEKWVALLDSGENEIIELFSYIKANASEWLQSGLETDVVPD